MSGFDFKEWVRGLDEAALGGAISGGLGGVAGSIPGLGGSSTALGMIRNSAVSATSSALMGDKVSLLNVGFAALGDLGAQAMLPKYVPTSTSGLHNLVEETVHSSVRGALSGTVRASLHFAAAGGRGYPGLGRYIGYGAIGGAGSALARNALLGWPRLTTDEVNAKRIKKMTEALDINPIYRSGGLKALAFKLLGQSFRSSNFGRDIHLDPDDASMSGAKVGETMVHEAFHLYQARRDGVLKMWGGAWIEGIECRRQGLDVYLTPGTYEYECMQAQKIY